LVVFPCLSSFLRSISSLYFITSSRFEPREPLRPLCSGSPLSKLRLV
jgi:hypothetical protein